MKRIILCADDYGQNSAISQAIIQLIEKKRLSATSCMTTTPHWLIEAHPLKSYVDEVDIGLHFNLTEGQPLSSLKSFYSLKELIVKSHLRVLDQTAIETELHRQLDQFETGLQRMPDFIDGHQHVHQLPVVREALFSVYKNRFPDKKCYIRCTTMPLRSQGLNGKAQLKKIIIQLCGTHTFKKQLINLNIPHNTSFAGLYDFDHAKKYSAIFPQFIKEIKHKGIIMCHPGYFTNDVSDSIAKSRDYEFHYFSGESFIAACQLHEIQIARFNDL